MRRFLARSCAVVIQVQPTKHTLNTLARKPVCATMELDHARARFGVTENRRAHPGTPRFEAGKNFDLVQIGEHNLQPGNPRLHLPAYLVLKRTTLKLA